jgi:hypothetical protein
MSSFLRIQRPLLGYTNRFHGYTRPAEFLYNDGPVDLDSLLEGYKLLVFELALACPPESRP